MKEILEMSTFAIVRIHSIDKVNKKNLVTQKFPKI